MSLHEIDLAQKISDKVVCVKGDHISLFGEPEQIFTYDNIKELYSIDNGSYDPVFGSIELPRPKGEPDTFVFSSCGSGIPVFRRLQKEGVPFIVGVLYKNDIDYELATHLATEIIEEKPFCELRPETVQKAKAAIDRCSRVINAGVEIGDCNKAVQELLEYAKISGKLS